MNFDFKSIGPLAGSLIKAGAPTLGSLVGGLVGGPLGGIAGDLAGNVLGDIAGALGAPPDAAPEVLQQTIEANPAAAQAALATVESEYKIEVEDRANARAQTIALAQANSEIAWGAPVVSVLGIVMFAIVIAMAMFGHTMETPNGGIIIGTVTSGYATILAYWLGSSSSSKTNGAAVRSLAAVATLKKR